MRKVLSFSVFLIIGLFLSQFLPVLAGSGYGAVKTVANILLYICLGFIMINVGREFEVDKSRWKSYTEDYFIAMATAAMPWLLIALYYVFVLLPPEFWNSWNVERELITESVCSSYFCRYSFYYVGCHWAQSKLDVQEDSGTCHFR